MRSGVHAYLLRPEAVEAFFVMWRLTGDNRYREYGWGVFRAIEQWCKACFAASMSDLMRILGWLHASCVCFVIITCRVAQQWLFVRHTHQEVNFVTVHLHSQHV